jgi:hypothetical protein
MAVAAFANIRSMVRRETTDTRGTRWTDDELDKYINIAQETYVRRTGALVSTYDVYSDGITNIFEAPSDFIRPREFIVNNELKTTIPITDWKKLDEAYTPKFLSDTNSFGGPYNICFNFESWNKFTFYPVQDVAQGTLIGTLKYVRKPVIDTLEVNNDETIANFTLYRIYLKERNSRYLKKALKYKLKFGNMYQKMKSRSSGSIKQKAAYRSGRFF